VVRNRLADAIGEIAATIYKTEGSWDELIHYLLKAAFSEINVQSAHSLKILGVLFTYAHSYMSKYNTEVFKIFDTTLKSENPEIILNSIEALTNLLSVIDGVYVETYRPLLTKYLTSTVTLLGLDSIDGKSALEQLVYLAEAEPKFLKKDVQTLY